ncbi:unnamed protein product [Rotaria magnacalcarata]|uniref:Uncharacterized protein n=2 Tax=Rotaria magnacalcarata TaxID=392030 RepID=A0A816R043_9BILA|nr:unnamed protein product [Rotaria magnacalcarata]CAF3953339.1 unnamed protein product [Rotaria magnacalcarata]
MSELKPDSLEALERLISEQTSYIDEVDKQIAKWTQFEYDYRQLHTRLSTLPDRLTYDCMVPFGKLAFIPGRIIHSNEILVLLGDNYFVERTCKQSIDIVNRRMGNIKENIEKHHKEKEVFNQQKKYTHDFLDDRKSFFEIKETDNDDNTTITKQEIKPTNRRAKLTDEEIREERRRLQERATKITETKPKRVRFDDETMDVDSDNDDLPNEQFRKIFIHHTKNDFQPIGDSSPALFSHPGAIGVINNSPVAALTQTVEPPKRISKFKASRQQQQ